MFEKLTSIEKYELLTRLVRGYQNTQDEDMASELLQITLLLF